MEHILTAFDQPFSGTVSTFFLTKLIKKHVKVALSGDAADELFGSYLTHRVAYPMARFAGLRGRVTSGELSTQEKEALAGCDPVFLEDLYSRSRGEEFRWRYHLGLFTDPEKSGLLTGPFRDMAGKNSTLDFFRDQFAHLTSRDPLNRVLEMEWNTQLPDQMLAFADFLSMAHSVEIRSPFLDYRLVEFVATIPGRFKISNGSVKNILKKAARGLIPEEITRRPKEGFVLPVFSWMEGQIEGFCKDVLSGQRIRRHGLFSEDAVLRLVREYYGGDRSRAGRIWNLIMFQLWWEKYFG